MKKLTQGRVLTESQAARLRSLARLHKPKMGKSWRHRSPDQLWLRVLSQIVVAGNAAPGGWPTLSVASPSSPQLTGFTGG
jgi:hypothetical protein